MIHSMEEIAMRLLKEFYKRTKFKPSRLIFYRCLFKIFTIIEHFPPEMECLKVNS